MVEKWRDCTGEWFGLYKVSSLGNIKTNSYGQGRVFGRIRKISSVCNKGYPHIQLYRNCKGTTVKVHRLVATAFIGVRPPGHSVDHIDGNKLNNKLSNLEYVTTQENTRRASRMGLMKVDWSKRKNKPKGKKLTFEIAEQIRKRVKGGERRVLIAQEYNIHQMTVGEIVREEIWSRRIHGKTN